MIWVLIAIGVIGTVWSVPKYAHFFLLSLSATAMLLFHRYHGVTPGELYAIFWLVWMLAFLSAILKTVKVTKAFMASIATFVAMGVVMIVAIFTAVGAQTATPAQASAVAFPDYQVATVSKVLQNGDTPKTTCDKAQYYAYGAPTGSHNFGPNLTLVNPTDINEAVTLFYQFVSCDPLAAATNEEFIRNGENLDPAVAAANAVKYNDDATRNEWAAAINRMRDRTVSYYLVNADGIRYDSIGMIPGANPNVMPTLTKFSEQPNLALALVLVDQDGHESVFRIWCHIQPAVKQFKKVTPAPAVQPAPPQSPGTPPKPHGNGTPPKSTTTKPPSSTTTTKPPSSTTTTKPPSSTTTPPSSTTTPPSSTTTPPSSTTTPPSSTTTPPSSTTTPPSSTTTPPSTTTTPVTTTTETKSSNTSDYPYPSSKPPVTDPPGPVETSLPPETNPVTTETGGAEVTATDLPAPSVETPPTSRVDIPTPEPTMAPPTEEPGTTITEPPAPQAPIVPQEVPAPLAPESDNAPQNLPAPPAEEPPAPAPAPEPAPVPQEAPVVPAPADPPAPPAPVGPAESAPPSVSGIGDTLPGAAMLMLPLGLWYRRKQDKQS